MCIAEKCTAFGLTCKNEPDLGICALSRQSWVEPRVQGLEQQHPQIPHVQLNIYVLQLKERKKKENLRRTKGSTLCNLEMDLPPLSCHKVIDYTAKATVPLISNSVDSPVAVLNQWGGQQIDRPICSSSRKKQKFMLHGSQTATNHKHQWTTISLVRAHLYQ